MMDRQTAIAQLTAPGQAYEIVDGRVWGRSCREFRNAPATLRELYETARSDETFLVFEGERYTFDETALKVARIAQVLVSRYGISKGDRVAISMRNYPEWVMAFNAITSIGAIAVSMNALWTSEEMAFGFCEFVFHNPWSAQQWIESKSAKCQAIQLVYGQCSGR